MNSQRCYPLSLNQQFMWFQCQLDPQSNFYNLAIRARLSGPLVVQTFLEAVQNTVNRHEILRTVFAISSDAPVQRVARDLVLDCPVREMPSGLSPDKLDDYVLTRTSALADGVYDLSFGPLFRTQLLRQDETTHYFIFAFHHLLLDAFYSGQLIKEIVSTYDLLRRQEPCPAPPSVQYGDFCVQQQERWNQGLLAATVSFWQEQLREPLPEVRLPTYRSTPPPRQMRSKVSLHLATGTVEQLREVGKCARTTLFRVITAAFVLFFSRFAESDELMIDVDFSTRPRGMGDTLGFFANLLPVRLLVQKQQTFVELLSAVDSQLRQVSANREFPVRQLTRKLRRPQHAEQPLSSVVLTQLGALDSRVGDLHLSGTIYVTAGIHDLWLGILEREDDLEIMFGYSNDILERGRVETWADGVAALVRGITAQPSATISQLAGLLEADRRESQCFATSPHEAHLLSQYANTPQSHQEAL